VCFIAQTQHTSFAHPRIIRLNGYGLDGEVSPRISENLEDFPWVDLPETPTYADNSRPGSRTNGIPPVSRTLPNVQFDSFFPGILVK
jgi:hypothetical protein